MSPSTPSLNAWAHSIPALILLAALVGVFAVVLVVLLRRFLSPRVAADASIPESRPNTENPGAFVAASMQAVIQKLRAQELELERLHRVEKERARETERLSEAVTRNMPAGLLVVGVTGVITSANPAAGNILGHHTLYFRGVNELFGAESAFAQMITACLRVGATFQRGEVEYTTPGGEQRRIGVTISPILQPARPPLRAGGAPQMSPEDMHVTGALCLMTDLTELTALQRQMRMRENLASLGEMAAGIAHEFKNSLATISGYAQMIRGDAASGDMAESAQRILDQTRALTHVVTEFLRFARPLELENEAIDVAALVETVVEEMRETMPQATFLADGGFGSVAGDDGLLRQALLNLIRNAAEAVASAGAKGRVAVSGAIEERGGKLWQRISVSDNGPGISPGDLPKLFLPFFTTKPEGTGLGLAVVQKIALQHGGSVEARNRREGGAEFDLWLPLRQQTADHAIASGAVGI